MSSFPKSIGGGTTISSVETSLALMASSLGVGAANAEGTGAEMGAPEPEMGASGSLITSLVMLDDEVCCFDLN